MRAASDWVEGVTDTIRTALSFLRTAMEDLDSWDPDAVRAVTEAVGTLAGAKLMADVVDERLNGSHERQQPCGPGARLN